MFKRTIASILVCLCFLQVWSQDRLLLTNGKIKELDGVVVYYDHDDILYQNDLQRERMKKYVVKSQAKKNKKETSQKWIDQQAKKTEKEDAKNRKAKQKLAERRKDLEAEIAEKMKVLFTEDFERWKTQELDRLLRKEQKRTLDSALNAQLESSKKNKAEARERAKFTTRVARDLVFSVLKPDSTELVVYSADTLGFLSEGDPEVDYGVKEMRAYMAGRQAGRNHNTNFDVVLGVGIGVISAAVGSFWGPSIPAGTVIVTSIANTKIKNKAGIDQAWLDDPAFRDGYDRSAKRKKAWNFVKGSIAGLGFGLLIGDGIFRNQLIPGPR